MNDMEKLVAIQEIRRLKARRVRSMDLKDWPGYAACHTDDAVTTTFQSEVGDTDPVVGGEAIAARLARQLEGRTTAHHVHEPEIEITSPTTASGIWPMEDMLWWAEAGTDHWIHGYGHYHETYQRVEGQWLIKSRRLSRIRVDRGTGTHADVMRSDTGA
ncbi:nuclear transport factor 2 family protein [Myxococcota bacterium]|nr:nuclear transport factor 2 family protein [Myxococcota bacterium]